MVTIVRDNAQALELVGVLSALADNAEHGTTEYRDTMRAFMAAAGVDLVTLRASDRLDVTVRNVYTSATLGDVGRCLVHIPLTVSRNGETTTAHYTFRVELFADNVRVFGYFDHAPTLWNGKTFAPLPDKARSLIAEYVKGKLEQAITERAADLVALAYAEQGRSDIYRALAVCRRSLDDVARGVSR